MKKRVASKNLWELVDNAYQDYLDVVKETTGGRADPCAAMHQRIMWGICMDRPLKRLFKTVEATGDFYPNQEDW